jgi:hypothetical protein|tara:strand:- start:207 stop:476 length:270 start_codon:yes stop_codon:yes gene_type:complete
MAAIRDILSLPLVYRTWQPPFAQGRIKPILETTDLTKADRGDFARSLDPWREIFPNLFELVQFEPFPLKMFGISLWKMVYFKGKLKRTA